MSKMRLIMNAIPRIIAKIGLLTKYRADEVAPKITNSRRNLYGSGSFNDALGAMKVPHNIAKSSGEPIPKTNFVYALFPT